MSNVGQNFPRYSKGYLEFFTEFRNLYLFIYLFISLFLAEPLQIFPRNACLENTNIGSRME